MKHLHLRPFPAVYEVIDAKMVGQALHRRVIVHSVVVVRVQRRDESGRVGAQPGHALPALGQSAEMPRAVVPLPGPSSVRGGRQQRVDAGDEAAETRAVLRGRRRRRLGLGGGRRSVQAGRGRAQEAGGVGELVRALLRLDGQRAAVSRAHVRSPLSLPPEVAVVEHLLTVGVQRPVVPFTWSRNSENHELNTVRPRFTIHFISKSGLKKCL